MSKSNYNKKAYEIHRLFLTLDPDERDRLMKSLEKLSMDSRQDGSNEMTTEL